MYIEKTVPCHHWGPDACTTPLLMEAFQLTAWLPGIFLQENKPFAFFVCFLSEFFIYWLIDWSQGKPSFKGSHATLYSLPLQHHGCKGRAATWSFPSQNSGALRLSKFWGIEGPPRQLAVFFSLIFTPKSTPNHMVLSLFFPPLFRAYLAACKTLWPVNFSPPSQIPVATPTKAPAISWFFERKGLALD